VAVVFCMINKLFIALRQHSINHLKRERKEDKSFNCIIRSFDRSCSYPRYRCFDSTARRWFMAASLVIQGEEGWVDTWDSQTGLYLTTTWQVVFIGTRIFALDDNRQSGLVVKR
jgi:hypothetical protein